MVDEREQLDRYLGIYDDLAVEVLDDDRPNTGYGLPYTNAEVTQIVLNDMDWESFDLFQKVDYQGAYESEDSDNVRAYSLIAFLRMMLFSAAYANHVGDPEFNRGASAFSEYWFKRLSDRLEAVVTKQKETAHKWIH